MVEVLGNGEKSDYDVSKCPFSWDKLDGLLAYKSSLVICSSILEVAEKTIQNHIKRRYGQTFTEYADRRLSPTKVKLVSKAIEMAMSGNNTMMIFCLKNICKWADRTETNIEAAQNIINLSYKEKPKEI